MTILEGKVAIVTGGAKGMGKGHVEALLDAGAKVVLTDVDEEGGNEVVKSLGEDTLFVKHDVTKIEDWENVLVKTNKKFGPVDILVSNAGVGGPHAKIEDLSAEDYMTTINVDLNGVFLGMKTLIPHMLKNGGGSIINISSVAGLRHDAVAPNAAYTTSKHGVIGLTRAGAAEYAKEGVKINAVAPGTVLTPMLKEALSEEEQEQVGSISPIGRFAEIEEISNAIIYLASDKSSYVNGEVLVIDGGTAAS
jgi:3alpha(or 20beta)-hydroxysteroid dehydrogenase